MVYELDLALCFFPFINRREAAAVNANRAVKKLKDELDDAESKRTEVTRVGN